MTRGEADAFSALTVSFALVFISFMEFLRVLSQHL